MDGHDQEDKHISLNGYGPDNIREDAKCVYIV